jgi:uncharacterized OB-fold protein
VTDAAPGYTRPSPVLDADNAFYWRAAARGELRVQSCGECGALCHPPVPLCPVCHSDERQSRQVSGLGRVASFMIVHHPPNPWFEMPIGVVSIELEEGPQVTSNIVGVPLEEVDLGMEVEVLFAATDDPEVGVPLFRPRGR